jgi:NADH:ubiquinone oxidoreductase subunit F (NADH-binding)/NADH:ubiquinone oxidoreductase subunit E
MNKIQKITAGKRDFFSPKGRQVDDTTIANVKSILGDLEIRRDLLIEALHKVQDAYGYINASDMAALAEIFRLSQAEVYEVGSFYHHFNIIKEDQEKPFKSKLRICDGLSCEMAGANTLFQKIKEKFKTEKIEVEKVPCIGRCASAPAARFNKEPIDNMDVDKIVEVHRAGMSFALNLPKYETLVDYIGRGGYGIFNKLKTGAIEPEEIIKTVSDANLKGLGGAGFPAGRKWEIVKSFKGPRLMTVNGDEGEPGTFKDRFWLESRPHQMLEGALIAAKIVGCEKIYIYMRDEYPEVLEILKTEIASIEKEKIATIPIEVRRGAGAYICGEESAMIESIEGKRGVPRHRPPYIAEVGLFGKPTLNHNIETLNWLPEIIENGVDWFKNKGWDDKHSGIRSFSVSGRVKNPGVKLTPAGIPLSKLITDYCGGMQDGHILKAFFPGGASGGILPAHLAHLPLDFGTFEKFGGFIGSHAIVVLSDQDNIKDAALNTMRFFKHESCGQCTPCRSGTDKMIRLLEDSNKEIELYNALIKVMSDSSICGLGQAASNCVSHLINHFPEEF